MPAFIELVQEVENGATVFPKNVIHVCTQQLEQYSSHLAYKGQLAEANLIDQYCQKIKNDIDEVSIILVERALPSCGASCNSVPIINTLTNAPCTKETCFNAPTSQTIGTLSGPIIINGTDSGDCGNPARFEPASVRLRFLRLHQRRLLGCHSGQDALDCLLDPVFRGGDLDFPGAPLQLHCDHIRL